MDLQKLGKVSKNEFQTAINKNRVYLSKEEMNKIFLMFGEDDSINYSKISN